jgi:hypothetical protein
MVLYACNTCLKKFTKKTDYERHMNRKNPCTAPIKDDTRDLLNKIDSLSKRVEELEKKEAEYNNLEIKIKKLENEIKTPKIKSSNVTNNVQINNIQINRIEHGKEDLSFLTDADIREILLNGLKGVMKYVELINCNKNKPEYRNIYISSSKNKNGSIRVFIDNEWQLRNKAIINDLRDKGIDFMVENYEDYKENKNDVRINNMGVRFNNKLDNDTDYKWRDNLSENIKIILCNNKPKD